MRSLPDWDSPEDIESHTESALFFLSDSCSLAEDRQLEQLRQKLQRDASDSLSIRVFPDGLEKLSDEARNLYLNSAWVVDYELLRGDVDRINEPADELPFKLKQEFFPDVTHVYVFVDTDAVSVSRAKEHIQNTYGMSKMDVTDNYSVLEGMLRNYFCHMADPGSGRCARSSIYQWAQAIKRELR